MFSTIIGQEPAITILQQALRRDRIAPAYLFVGMPGIGKALTAREFARLLLATESETQHPDLLWVEPTYSDRGNLITATQAQVQGLKKKANPKIRIEQIRELSHFLLRLPLKSDRLVVIIESAHFMAEAAANALLKTLEEPGKAVIILTAPGIDSLLSTIISRCQVIRFAPLSTTELKRILVKEGHEAITQNSSLLAMAQGSPGKSISAWEELQRLDDLDPALLNRLQQSPQDTFSALLMAKQIASQLELTTQLWLIDYLQNYDWQHNPSPTKTQTWEVAKKYLRNYVQPRLVWENLLLASFE